ncbi:MAG: glycosyltransferase [bacterium]|nr:glycosyltransferase [bacterium]
MLTVILPVRNEEPIIAATIERLLTFLHATLHEPWRVIVADNASTDRTRDVVRDAIVHDGTHLALLELDRPGKGHAVMSAWRKAASETTTACHCEPNPRGVAIPVISVQGESRVHCMAGIATSRTPRNDKQGSFAEVPQNIFLFLDADLATDLRHIPELIAAVRSGADIAAASRYLPGSQTHRSTFRHIISRANALLLRLRFGLRMTDAPCGAKAVNARVVRDIVPLIRDDQWFFDTELCIRAQRAGFRIVEIPIAWHEPREGVAIAKVLRIIVRNCRTILRSPL